MSRIVSSPSPSARSRTGTSAFGSVSVYGLSRRPAPAANTIPIKVIPFVTPPQVRESTARKAILPGMNDRLRGAGRRLGRVAPGSTRQEVADLRQRVTELEAEVQEA